MKNFVKGYKFVLIGAFLEGLPSKGSKKFFDVAEFRGVIALVASIWIVSSCFLIL